MLKRKGLSIFSSLKRYLDLNGDDLLKMLLLSAAYFFIICSYSILRPLKTSIFLGLVGPEFQPISRIISLLIIFPCGLAYAKLIDKVKRHQIFFVVIGIYALLSFIFSFYLAHPDYGVLNTVTSPYRIIGWLYEIFMDMYSAIVVSTFWGYATSVSTPAFAGKSFGIITAISRVGGILTTSLGLLMLHKTSLPTQWSIPMLTLFAGVCLLLAIYSIYLINKKVPASALHGYEAAYKDEKQHAKDKVKPGIFEGIKLLLTQPYVLGIFGLVYSIEVVAVILDYQMNVRMSLETGNDIGAMSTIMFICTLCFQLVGLLFAIFGTTTLLKKIGIAKCLMIMPFTIIALSLSALLYPSLLTSCIIMIILRALNYGFNVPIREMLYVPTIKDVQFKAKVWIESFGKTFSKASGSTFNQGMVMFGTVASPYIVLLASSSFCIAISAAYGVISLLIGRKYLKTIKNNEVIGH